MSAPPGRLAAASVATCLALMLCRCSASSSAPATTAPVGSVASEPDAAAAAPAKAADASAHAASGAGARLLAVPHSEWYSSWEVVGVIRQGDQWLLAFDGLTNALAPQGEAPGLRPVEAESIGAPVASIVLVEQPGQPSIELDRAVATIARPEPAAPLLVVDGQSDELGSFHVVDFASSQVTTIQFGSTEWAAIERTAWAWGPGVRGIGAWRDERPRNAGPGKGRAVRSGGRARQSATKELAVFPTFEEGRVEPHLGEAFPLTELHHMGIGVAAGPTGTAGVQWYQTQNCCEPPGPAVLAATFFDTSGQEVRRSRQLLPTGLLNEPVLVLRADGALLVLAGTGQDPNLTWSEAVVYGFDGSGSPLSPVRVPIQGLVQDGRVVMLECGGQEWIVWNRQELTREVLVAWTLGDDGELSGPVTLASFDFPQGWPEPHQLLQERAMRTFCGGDRAALAYAFPLGACTNAAAPIQRPDRLLGVAFVEWDARSGLGPSPGLSRAESGESGIEP